MTIVNCRFLTNYLFGHKFISKIQRLNVKQLNPYKMVFIFSHTHAYGVKKSLCFLVSGKIGPISVTVG